MSIRQKLNQNPTVTGAVTIVLIGLAGFFLWHTLRPASITRTLETQDYFCDEDGNNVFIDDAKNIPPFEHNGKTAVRAKIWKCRNSKGEFGPPYIQRLEKYDEAAKTEIETQVKGGLNPFGAMAGFNGKGMLLKKPGDKEWIHSPDASNKDAKAWKDLQTPQCPDGAAVPVSIKENAVGAKPQ